MNKHTDLSAGQTTQQGGFKNRMEENNITIGAATYVISRHFNSEHQVTRRKLLCDLIAQKMESTESVDPRGSHGV